MTDLTERRRWRRTWLCGLKTMSCFITKNSMPKKKNKMWDDKAAELSKDTKTLIVWYRSLRTRYSLNKRSPGTDSRPDYKRDRWVLGKFSFLKVDVHEVRERTAISLSYNKISFSCHN